MSDREAKFRVSVDGRGELADFFSSSERAAQSSTSKIGGYFREAGKHLQSFASSVSSVVGPLATLGAGVGIAEQAKSVIELRDAVVGLAANAGLADGQIAQLRGEIVKASGATNQFGTDLTDALNAFVAKTGDIESGRKLLELYGKTATATRASVSDLANIGADLAKMKLTDLPSQTTALAILAKQADVGAVELKDLVGQGPRLLSAFQSAGLSGEQGLRQGGALAQVFQKGTGNVERTSTSVEATFRDIAERKDLLERSGIQVFDPKTHEARNRIDVLEDIIRKTHGREDLLRRTGKGGVFGDEAMRGVQIMANEYRETGGFGTFDQFRDVDADQSLIDRKFQLNTSSSAAQIKRARIQAQSSAENNMGDTIDEGVGMLGGLYSTASEHPLASAALAFGAKQTLGGGLGKLLFGRGGGGAAQGLISGATGEGSRVFVTNWPEGGPGGGGALGAVGEGGAIAGEAGGLIAALGGAAGLIPLIGGSLMVAGVGAMIAKTMTEIGGDRDAMGSEWRAKHAAVIVAEQKAHDDAQPKDNPEDEEARRFAALTPDQQREERLRKLNGVVDPAPALSVNAAVGQYGGAITPEQARAAQKGKGAFAYSAGGTLEKYEEQQRSLLALEHGAEGGLPDEALGDESDPEMASLLRNIKVAHPEFSKLKGSKARGDFFKSLIAENDKALQPDDGVPALLRAPGADDGAAPRVDNAVNLTINIDALGNASVDGDTGTRAPRIQVRRTAGEG